MRDQCLPSGWEAEKGMADVHQGCKFTVRYITPSIQAPNFISREIGVLSLRAATRDRDRGRTYGGLIKGNAHSPHGRPPLES